MRTMAARPWLVTRRSPQNGNPADGLGVRRTPSDLPRGHLERVLTAFQMCVYT